MEPQFNAPPQMNLPPVAEQEPVASVPEQSAQAVSPELGGSQPQSSTSALPPISAIPQKPLPTNATTQSAATNATIADLPAIAEDADLIEKEWVNKAKQIVEQTRENPYEQTKSMSNLKTDYMKKRYNRLVKSTG